MAADLDAALDTLALLLVRLRRDAGPELPPGVYQFHFQGTLITAQQVTNVAKAFQAAADGLDVTLGHRSRKP